jgi:hypothetical protein
MVRHQRTSGDKAMIAVLLFAIALSLGLIVFDIVLIVTLAYDEKQGLKAIGAFAIFIFICYGALQRRIKNSQGTKSSRF